MITMFFLVTFVSLILTGPAGVDCRQSLRARRDFARARVLYLPSAACRPSEDA